MSYPRNAAAPEPIAIGAVIQISDGAVQSSGVTVRIKPIGVGEGDGGGTTAYSTDGIVLYTPTQAETNYTSFILIAKKTGCIPVAITVVTSASATAGYAGLDWSKVANPTTTLGLSGTTVKTATDIATLIGTAGAGLTALGDTRLANLDATVSSRLATAGYTTPPTVSQIWTTALTEAYRATGATGTAAQLLYEILQNLTEFAIASTTKTVKKLDGATTAKTYTLDSATVPTSITEAT